MVEVVINTSSLSPIYALDEKDKALNHIEDMLRGLACFDEVDLLSSANLWIVPLLSGPNGIDCSFGDVVHMLYSDAKRWDVAAFFDELQRMSPCDVRLNDEQIEALLSCPSVGPIPGMEMTWPAVQSAGLEAVQCGLNDSILASLCRDAVLDHDRLGFVSEEPFGTIQFDHISKPHHGQSIRSRRDNRDLPSLTRRNFWDLKDIYFPNLCFGLDVEAQISIFSAPYLNLLFRRLRELDRFSSDISDCREPLSRELKERVGIRPESDLTMDNYENERLFRNSKGENCIFEEHIWIDRQNRIHLIIHDDAPRIEIGYAGVHLRTWNH